MEKRRRRPLLGNRAYKEYPNEMLEVAVDLVSRKEISSLEAEKRFHIPRRTIDNKVKNKHSRKPGGQQRFSDTEEQNIVNVLRAAVLVSIGEMLLACRSSIDCTSESVRMGSTT